MSLHTRLRNELLDYITINNPSSYAPYHNNVHMEQMEAIAMSIYIKDAVAGSEDQRMVLTLASLMHDFNHSAGEKPDSENITAAVSALTEFCHNHSKILKSMRNKPGARDEYLRVTAIAAIRCTQFPFVREPVTLVEKCMRDADVLYPAMSGTPEIVAVDLRGEMNVALGYKLSDDQLLKQQRDFINSAVLFTDTGKKLWDEHAERYYKKLEKFLKSRS